jgi:hypothetical protein
MEDFKTDGKNVRGILSLKREEREKKGERELQHYEETRKDGVDKTDLRRGGNKERKEEREGGIN